MGSGRAAQHGPDVELIGLGFCVRNESITGRQRRSHPHTFPAPIRATSASIAQPLRRMVTSIDFGRDQDVLGGRWNIVREGGAFHKKDWDGQNITSA